MVVNPTGAQNDGRSSRETKWVGQVYAQRKKVEATSELKPGDLDDPRSDVRLRRAVATYDSIETEKVRFPANGNAWKRLDSLQKKLFYDDFSYASFSGGLDCGDRDATFEKLKASKQTAAEGGDLTAPTGSLPEPGQVLQQRYALLASSGNIGFSNIVQVITSVGGVNPLDSQAFMDGSIYVASKTYLNGLLADEMKRAGAMENRLKESLPPGSEKQLASFSESSDRQLSEFRSVLESYRTIYQKRFEGLFGATSEEIMKKLDELELKDAGPELNIPCP